MNQEERTSAFGNVMVPLRRAVSLGILALLAGGACKKAETLAEGTAAGSASGAAARLCVS